MNGKSFLIDIVINKFYSVSALINNGCDCLAAVSNSIARKANLPRIIICPRKLTEVTNAAKEDEHIISEMTEFHIDINGYEMLLKAYIIPKLSHDVILGKLWIEKEDVIYYARKHCTDIKEAIIDNKPLRV